MMKNPYLFLCITLFLFSCGDEDKKAAENNTENQPQAAGKNTAAFNQSFDKLLNAYYALKDGLVEYDTAKANAASQQLDYKMLRLNLEPELLSVRPPGIYNPMKGSVLSVITEPANPPC